VDIRDNGSVDGDIISPRVAIAEGAHFRGSVDMQRKPGQPGQQASTQKQTQPQAQAQSQSQNQQQNQNQPVVAR
jgi:cytoskeletal protein CcmA (bactofilin family)